MSLQSEKMQLVRLILATENSRVLNEIKLLFQKEGKVDFWDELSVEQQAEVMEGIEQAEKGEMLSFEDFVAKWRS